MRSLRIGLLTELYPPSLGGQELFFEGLGKALSRRGHVVEVLCIGHAEGLPATEQRDGITVHRFPMAPNYIHPLKPWMKRSWTTIFQYAWFTRRHAQRNPQDFYILNQWPLLHAVTLPAAMRRRSALHWCEVREGRFYRLVQKYLPRRVRWNLAIGDAVGQAIELASGRPTMTVPSGLHLEEYATRPPEQRSGILFLGRIAPHKNLPMLVDAFEALKAGGYDGRLTIAGDGSGMTELRQRVAASPVASDIDLVGVVDDPRKVELLASASVLAMPSKREGFPRVVAEAMASGLPVVTADFPENGTRDIVKLAVSGVVTAPTTEAYASGIRDALANWAGYSANGLRFSRSLDWDQIAARLEASFLA
jgi:glycosyltransferase involved in cell wall biosynthesis